MKNNLFFLFSLIILLLTRLLFIGNLPLSLNWDEVSHGYNAYSVLNTGFDQWGKFPIFNFRAYGDYPTTLNLYLTIPFIKIFGLNSFAIRLPHALFSIAFSIMIFFFTKEITKNKSIGLICFFLSSVSPWLIFPGRGVFQSNLSQLLIILGLYFYFKSKPSFFLSTIFLIISTYSYHNSRISAPIIIFLFFLHQTFLKKFSKQYFLSLLFIILFLVPNFINIFSPESSARNQWVGIINQSSINKIEESRRLFQGPEIINKLINNRYLYFSKTIAINIINIFSPKYVFFEGSQNYQFNPPHTGLIFVFLFPFLYLGIFLFPKFIPKNYPFLFLIFFILLLPSILTTGDFPSIRLTQATPFYFLFISFGLSFLFSKFSKTIMIFIFLSFFSLLFYLKNYYEYCHNYSLTWQYGYQPLVNEIKKIYSSVDKIYITKKYGEPHEFVLFYWPFDPNKYQPSWNYHDNWFWVNSFDKFVFYNDYEFNQTKFPANSLVITSPSNQLTNSNLIKSIYTPNNQKIFDIYKNE